MKGRSTWAVGLWGMFSNLESGLLVWSEYGIGTDDWDRAVPGNPRPAVRSTYTGSIPLMLCHLKVLSKRRDREGNKGVRSHTCCGPGVGLGCLCLPRLHRLWQHFLLLLTPLVLGRQVLWSSPHPSSTPIHSCPTTGKSWDPVMPSPCSRVSSGKWGFSLIQWGSLAQGITSAWNVQKPARVQAGQGGPD